jgi:hypothetical protein
MIQVGLATIQRSARHRFYAKMCGSQFLRLRHNSPTMRLRWNHRHPQVLSCYAPLVKPPSPSPSGARRLGKSATPLPSFRLGPRPSESNRSALLCLEVEEEGRKQIRKFCKVLDTMSWTHLNSAKNKLFYAGRFRKTAGFPVQNVFFFYAYKLAETSKMHSKS